jgi:hypothetical protein
MYEQDYKQDVSVMSLAIHPRGIQEVHTRETGHDTEGVRCTLARFSSVMYAIVLGVTPPDTLRKINQDNYVCSTLTSNLI